MNIPVRGVVKMNNNSPSNSNSNSNTNTNDSWLPYMNNHGSNVVLTPPPAPSFKTRDHVIGFITKLKLTIDSSESLSELLYKGKLIDQLIGLALSIEAGKVHIENVTLRYVKNSIKSLIQKYNKKMIEFRNSEGGSLSRSKRKTRQLRQVKSRKGKGKGKTKSRKQNNTCFKV
jgi:hypothetical protein